MISDFPLAETLLDWYAVNGRDMPWRVKGGAHSDPYAVWISEIMLQQTTVATVKDYFIRWMQKYPTITDLANADLQDVLLGWQGLGYYTRAKKIHECAQLVVNRYGGQLPANRDELLKLPGIGPYTASSICCFAFNMPETVVDGNVIRVIARLYGLTHEVTKEEIYDLAKQITPGHAGADYASAIMDLGATVCTTPEPKCLLCPWHSVCVACRERTAPQIPLKKKLAKKEKTGTVYLIQNKDGAYFIRKRPGKGLLSGLYEFPWLETTETPLYPPTQNDKPITVKHVFTHFTLTLICQPVKSDTPPYPDGVFVKPADFDKYPFSTLMQKVIKVLSNKFN